jgi:Pentatricopeptide repeat domain
MMIDNNLSWRNKLLELHQQVKLKTKSFSTALQIAQQYYTQCKADKLRPEIDILNAHFQLCDSERQAEQVIALYAHDGLRLNATSYNLLIGIAKNMDEASLVFDTMVLEKIYPSTFTINGMIAHCKDYQQAKYWYAKLQLLNLKPTVQTFNGLLKKTKQKLETDEVLENMSAQRIGITVVTINTLIAIATNFNAANNYYQLFATHTVQPTINTMITLLKKASNKKEALLVENKLKTHGISKNAAWDKHWLSLVAW